MESSTPIMAEEIQAVSNAFELLMKRYKDGEITVEELQHLYETMPLF